MANREISKIQEQALIGHMICDELVFNMLDSLGLEVLSPNCQSIFKRTKEFHSLHRRHPSELEIRSILFQDEKVVSDALIRTLDECIRIKKEVRIETIQPQILLIAERQLLAAKMTKAAELYNKSLEMFNKNGGSAGEKEHQESKDLIRNMNLEFEKLALAATGAKFESMGSRAEGEREERVSRASRIIPTGIQYLDDATSGGIAPQDLWIISAQSGYGKCLGLGTLVLMFDGTTKKVEDVIVGDLLMGPDSLPRKVLSTVRDRGPLYKIIPVKGEPWICNDAHILTLVDTRNDKITDISVVDYLKKNITFRRVHKQFSVGVDFQKTKDLPVDPYFVGVWIGDGSKSCRMYISGSELCDLRITNIDQEIIDECRKTAENWGLKLRTSGIEHFVSSSKKTTYQGKSNELLNAMRVVWKDKRIPFNYLTSSRKDRLELLAGLIDSDGSASGKCIDWIQKNKNTADDMAFLARSLGFRVTMKSCIKTCQTGNGGIYWRLTISGETSIIPCRLLRKQFEERLQIKNVLRTGITVSSIGEGEYAGFQIDGDGHFLLGDFTVTHNTQCMLSIAVNAGNTNNNRRVAFFALEAEKNELERRYKFTLMLKAYNKANPGNQTFIDMPAWLKGELSVTTLLAPYDNEANEEMLLKLKNVQTFYRGYGKYTVTELERDIISRGKDCDLILVDHIGYIDLDGDNENKSVVDMMHRLRDLSSIGRGVPIIAASQTRKGDGKTPRRFAPLLPSMEDINGSKAISTCATHVVTLGRVYEPVHFASDNNSNPGGVVYNPTLIHLQKFRPADRIRHTALCMYDDKAGRYYKSYALGRTTMGDTVWEPVSPVPPWAKHGDLGNVEPIEPKKLEGK